MSEFTEDARVLYNRFYRLAVTQAEIEDQIKEAAEYLNDGQEAVLAVEELLKEWSEDENAISNEAKVNAGDR